MHQSATVDSNLRQNPLWKIASFLLFHTVFNMKLFTKRCWNRALTGLLIGSSLSLPVQAADLETALLKLAEEHPRIVAERQNVASAESSVNEAWAAYLPRLDSEASIGYEDTDRTALVPSGTEFDLTPRSANVTLTQNLFEGFRIPGQINSAKSSLEQSKASLNATTQQVLFEGARTYIAVLRQVRLTELSKRNMANLTTQLDLEDERVERGSGVAVDVLQAKSRLQIAKERYTAFVGGLEESVAQYVQIFGETPDIETMSLPSLPKDKIPQTLDDAISKARQMNPTLKAVDATVENLSHRKTIAKAGYYPDIDVVAFSSYDNNIGGIRGTDISNSVMLRSRWNLFAGFADKARIDQSIAQHQSGIASGQDTTRRVFEAVKLAWTNMNISKKRSDLLENAVNIAGEVLDARTRLRDVGKDTAINVLDAENELFRAQIDAAAANYNYHASVYQLLLSTGQLDSLVSYTKNES
jgi:adhesin transport system outer membrane protein